MSRIRLVASAALACLLALSGMLPEGTAAEAPVGPRLAGIQTWTGDFEGMLKRHIVRIIVP
jgi:hypothetical protein